MHRNLMVLSPVTKQTIASNAEVWAAAAARDAAVMGAWTADHQHCQVAGRQASDVAPDVHDFAERFMPDDEVWGVRRRRAVLERRDLTVGPADPGLQDA